jgi:hypothetical protein
VRQVNPAASFPGRDRVRVLPGWQPPVPKWHPGATLAAMRPESLRDEPFELTFDLTDEQRAELLEAMAEIDRGEYVEGDVFLRELGIPR